MPSPRGAWRKVPLWNEMGLGMETRFRRREIKNVTFSAILKCCLGFPRRLAQEAEPGGAWGEVPPGLLLRTSSRDAAR